jgi:hypothetical protein
MAFAILDVTAIADVIRPVSTTPYNPPRYTQG